MGCISYQTDKLSVSLSFVTWLALSVVAYASRLGDIMLKSQYQLATTSLFEKWLVVTRPVSRSVASAILSALRPLSLH
jgi:hypothetical protein